MAESPEFLPMISVIIPVYNGEPALPRLLQSLKDLDYPSERLEVLLVDNNSTDRTADLIRESGFTYLRETEVQSSYAARNRGIKASREEVLAFTDADGWVDPAWLRQAISCMENQQADLVAGKVKWVIADPANIYEIYGKYQFERQEEFVQNGFCGTGNVLIRRQVFEKMGYFDTRMVSSGDKVFTQRAREAGFRLVYCPEARVYHETRKTLEAMRRKSRRIGFGLAQESYYYGSGGYLFYSWKWYVPGIRSFREINSSHNLSILQKVKLFFVIWLCKLDWVRGNWAGYLYSRQGKILASKDQ
jgi:cellulose synthase/poly-beta-1,6-N-acetylglucosamine synthase-like glycosyltransferase